ncbi:MAG: 3-oxoacyl-ACP synthase [Nannocystaceae bacterium]
MHAEPIGILSAGAYVPRTSLSAADLAERTGVPEAVIRDKFGIEARPIPGEGDHTGAMGLWAAQDAVARAGIDPGEIDLVLCTTEEHKEYPLWTAGIKLAHDLGARKAWAIDVQLRCGTTMAALRMAKAMMRSEPGIRTALIAGGYRNCDFVDLANPRSRFLTNLSAGGGALLLRRGHPRSELLGSSVITDGSFSLDVIVPVGGTVEPLTPDNFDRHYLDVPDPEGMKGRLDRLSMANFLRVIDEALAASDLGRGDIGFLNILHMKRSAHEYILGQLGLGPEQTIYLSRYGHIGQQDQPLSYKLAEDQGRLRDGTIMVMVAAGIGYAWSASVIRYGDAEAAR